MNELTAEFREEYDAVLTNAERFCCAARAKELQHEATLKLQALKQKATLLKERAVDARNEDAANQMLCYEYIINTLWHELKMWIALKDDDGNRAWEHLIDAQSDARCAIHAHDTASHLSNYIKRLALLEHLLFPKLAFVSVGVLISRSTCTICGEEYGECNHLKGKAYMGQLCAEEIHDAKLLETSIVDVPASKHNRILQVPDGEVMRDAITWRVIN
jgi:hypothetical protein